MTEKLEVRELTLANGLGWPTDEELIMLILGSGTKDTPVDQLSQKVLSVLDGVNPPEYISELMQIPGIGANRALTLAAALELGRRINRSPQASIKSPRDVLPFVKHYSMRPVEHFICVTVNGAKEIMNIRVICTGGGNMAVVKPRDIFCEAVKERASAVLFCHNHPNGICLPSREDIEMTDMLYMAGQYLGIAVLDHIIVTKNDYFSFIEHDLLPPRAEDDTVDS